jgi:hypothetical protein
MPNALAETRVERGKKPILAVGNAGYPWDYFDPDVYAADNYEDLYEDDRRIIQIVRDYFDSVADVFRPDTHGIDVGAGSNLYPALTMLPYCASVTLFERGIKNRVWLHEQRENYSKMWDPYWELLTKRAAYNKIEPREEFKRRVKIRRGDILRPPTRERFDLATMFFVAESITEEMNEFKRAVRNCIGLLSPGAPFAIAFMQESHGYRVGDIDFPAVAINPVDVDHHLRPLVDELSITSVRSSKPLREGYQGMILALGRAGRIKG